MDIRNEEFRTFLSMLRGKLEEDIAVNQFEAMVFGPKMLMRGEKAQEKIALAIRDTSLGIQVLENEQTIPISYNYQVIADKDKRYVENKIYEKTSESVISADKMNVVYPWSR
ncbi:hypothetical protein [Bacteroidetes bacterium endosymbiont of Geopemphigus sp.]|uniref:hypothetical protein n=1 Tax=Bacteroidetes bacterium endosymbiont of Geopemphigus sp. TaxID=2047937 RepID=UPI000CD210DD|nr:hypothetical protein [Bacteroidetes bacterium endosymbiont of Geopemphigus sp.]